MYVINLSGHFSNKMPLDYDKEASNETLTHWKFIERNEDVLSELGASLKVSITWR